MSKHTREQLRGGDKVAHMGNNENAGVKFWATITHFEYWLIWVKTDSGATYALNAWDICDRVPASKVWKTQMIAA